MQIVEGAADLHPPARQLSQVKNRAFSLKPGERFPWNIAHDGIDLISHRQKIQYLRQKRMIQVFQDIYLLTLICHGKPLALDLL